MNVSVTSVYAYSKSTHAGGMHACMLRKPPAQIAKGEELVLVFSVKIPHIHTTLYFSFVQLVKVLSEN